MRIAKTGLVLIGFALALTLIQGCKPPEKQTEQKQEQVEPPPPPPPAVSTTEGCRGSVKKSVQGGETTYEKLSCSGTCPDGTDCEWQVSEDHHGATREWCGCGETEPTDECFLVFYTPGEGTGGGDPEVICPPRNCDPGQTCSPVEEFRARDEQTGAEIWDVSCACQ